MRRWIRSTHLALSVAVTPFLALYALTSLWMAHPPLNPSSERQEVVELGTLQVSPDDASAIADLLRAEHGLQGRLLAHDLQGPGPWTLTFGRTGEWSQVVLDPGTRQATWTRHHANRPGLLISLHESAGFGEGRSAAERLWGGLVLGVGLALVGIVCTGIPLWWQRRSERRPGAIVLGLSALYAIVVLGAIRFG